MSALKGKTVIVTRARSQASELVAKLERLGAEVVEFPLIELIPATDQGPLEKAMERLDHFDWIVFTSVNGVHFFEKKLTELGRSLKDVQSRVGAVGPKTAEAIAKLGKKTDIVANDYQASGLLAALKPVLSPGQRVLLPRGDKAKADLPEGLRAWGLDVTEAVTYENVLSSEGKETVRQRLIAGKVDWITFTSSSTVSNFLALMGDDPIDDWLTGVKIACIGPVTEATAKQRGLVVDAVAREYTIDGLIEAICRHEEE